MKRLTTLAIAGVLAGCSATPSAPSPAPAPTTATANPAPPPAPAQPAAQDVDTSLARLRQLQIFEVYGIPQDGNCYAGDTKCLARVRAQAAASVATFTDTAVTAAALPPAEDGMNQAAVDANLASLRGLNTVMIGELLVAKPANNPNCYNLPCQSDIQAADALNHDREGRLANIARAIHP